MPSLPVSLDRLRPREPSWQFLRMAAKRELGRQAILTVEGSEHLPASGPVAIASRHYHHLLDGCALLSTIDRPTHVIVGLDWAEGGIGRAMGGLCKAARWPVVFRPPLEGSAERGIDGMTRFRALRTALRETTALLADGRVLVIFPEGYPNVDPHRTPKEGDAFLPFQPGLMRFVRAAEKAGVGGGRVPVVPVGFRYDRMDRPGGKGPSWRIAMRIGEARFRDAFPDDAAALAAIEADVHRLSA